MLSQALERFDLTMLHTILTLLGSGLSLYVMGLTGYVHEDREDPPWMQWSRRMVLGAIAMSLLWSLKFSQEKNWQPWPPEMGLIFAVVMMLAIRAVAIHLRLWRSGHYKRPLEDQRGALGRHVR